MFATITLLSPPYTDLTYILPDIFPDAFWKEGLRVAVPLGGGSKLATRSGYINSLAESSSLPSQVKCKEVFWPLETSPIINAELIALAKNIALRQGIPTGGVFGHILPAGLRSTSVKMVFAPELQRGEIKLSELSSLDNCSKRELATLIMLGQAYISPTSDDPALCEICALSIDPPWPVRPAAKLQIAILELLHEKGMSSRRSILKNFGSGAGKALKSLVLAGYVSIIRDIVEEDDACLLPPAAKSFELNFEQKQALCDLEDALIASRLESRLLYGVTGSGKTAIYLELAQKCLSMGKSVFLLAPEVALAHKLHRDTKIAMPEATLFFYHGYQSPQARQKMFLSIAERKNPAIIVGTRSALFLPVPNPGCIILDEEHDGSFKQDESFAYHAKEVAWFRMNYNKGLLLLGSATPDIKTFQACESGSLSILRLAQRVGGKSLPPARLVDIGAKTGLAAAGSIEASGQSILAPESEDELRQCMERGEQAVILLNRRGYSPMVFCTDCRKTLRCPHCEIGLSFHKEINKLVCHYCGFSMPYPSPCPECGHMNFMAIGEGTERLEERLEILARQPILRLDRDIARRPGKMEEILASFSAGKSPFLVGTQMLSKGHHFPNVTLVIVADGDIGLNLPDYRAAEKTFQLLVQAAGRAGRGDKEGKVLIQTRDQNHYCWNYILKYDYAGFYAAELARRKRHNYPPFIHLGLLRISFPASKPVCYEALSSLGNSLSAKARQSGIVLLGPAPAPISRLRGMRRFHCLIKSQQWNSIRDIYFFAKRHEAAKHLKLFLDLDPVNML